MGRTRNDQNLKPFTKGDDERRNIAGRPKITKLTDALREQLKEVALDEKTLAELIAKVLIDKALMGDVQAIKEIGDRTEGKPAQKIDVDLQLNDWRKIAAQNGLTEQDVFNEARLLLIESDFDTSGD